MNKKNFKANLALACGKDDMRPVMKHIFFDKGCAVATDAHILVKSNLVVHDFTEEEIACLEGYCVNVDQFRRIIKYPRIEVRFMGEITCITKDFEEITESLKLMSNIGTYPNYEAIIPTKLEAIESAIFDFNVLVKVKDLIVCENGKRARLEFHGPSRALLVKPDEDQIVLVMPCSKL